MQIETGKTISNSFEYILPKFENEQNFWFIIITSAIIIISSIIAHFIIFYALKRFHKRSRSKITYKIRQKLKMPSLLFFLLIAFTIIINIYAPNNKAFNILSHGLSIAVIFSITWILVRVIQSLRLLVLQHYDIEDDNNLKARKIATQFRIIERVLIFIIILVAIAIMLMTFDGIKNIGLSIFASAGIAGIILGLAAQKLLGTILAGFQIAFAQPIRIDDVVIVENEYGRIEEITLTYVVVRIWDKRRIILPTTYFIEEPFQNWTKSSSDILTTVYIYTDYTVSIDALRSELSKQLKKNEHWDGQVDKLQVTGSTDKTLELRALMSAKDAPTAWNLKVDIREKLVTFLQANYPESLPKTRVLMEKEA